MAIKKRLSSGLLLLSLAAFGCASDSNSPNAIHVPEGAEIIAFGTPPLNFSPPRSSHTIYIYDQDAEKVVYVTTTPDVPPGSEAAALVYPQPLNPDHKYRVYAIPSDRERQEWHNLTTQP